MDKQEVAMLATKAAQGDENAFNELYLQTRDAAYFVALSITKNEDDAADMVQEAYLTAWQKLATLDKPESFASWFNQITANAARMFLRKRKPLLFTEEEDTFDWEPEHDDEYVPHKSMDTAETKRLIMDIVDDLPEDQRLCVMLHYFDEMPVAEIASSIEVSVNTVTSRLFYARKKISTGVQALEQKQGLRLYAAAPIPLFIWALKQMAAGSAAHLPPAVLGGTAAAAAAGGAAAASAGTAGTTTAATGAAKAAAMTVPKIVAVIAATTVTVGAATWTYNPQPEPPAIAAAVASTATPSTATTTATTLLTTTLEPSSPATSETTPETMTQPILITETIETTETLPAAYMLTYMDNGQEYFREVNPSYITYQNPTRNHSAFSFLGWADSPTASSAQYHEGDSISLNRDLVFYAVWDMPDSLPKTISFNAMTAAQFYIFDSASKTEFRIKISNVRGRAAYVAIFPADKSSDDKVPEQADFDIDTQTWVVTYSLERGTQYIAYVSFASYSTLSYTRILGEIEMLDL